jgi:prepilin-type N-terminal cleavage/methylation domain-containing protein
VARRTEHGFTLIELMVVVVIVGVLSLLAVVGYRRLVTQSHVAEGTNTVANIRVAQEAYHSETQQYANISAMSGSVPKYFPLDSPKGNVVTGWQAVTCGSQCNTGIDWTSLPLHVDGPVMFGYATVAGPAGPQSALPIQSVTINGATWGLQAPGTDWYIVSAKCDLDSDGDGIDTTIWTTSWVNTQLIDHEGD